MDPIVSLSDMPKPLPQLPGPKLAPFTPTAHAEIEFVEELGSPAVDMDSFVWKVRINGSTSFYALKMFRFYSSTYLRQTTGRYLNRPFASPRRYIVYFDPFNCECRAYGRLQAESRQDLAIQAHGYLLLTPEQEASVAIRISAIGPDPRDPRDALDVTDDPWDRMEEHYGQPVHAIVKDFATDEYEFSPNQVCDMWRDLEDLHKLGILVRDIEIVNYLGGKLIDFSRSWTTPHPSLEHIHPRDLRRQR
ncbi:hypothetical protein C8A01DRAFT_40060 [Parachaetomium inaequale]|uniref:Uncharacterized protein n=1 Tax=Parachaetomium inaequale TaxID=2588326 RepID=A0AAN6SN62_9PEZI|nr:hypothetical protein C8A01DRAFT_40060 [Parachaetomium inaequale]